MRIKVEPVYWCKCGQTTHPHKGMLLRFKRFPHGQGRLKEYRIIGKIEFCCREMEKAYDENFIQFKNVMSHSGVTAHPIGCGLAIIKKTCFPECTCEDEMYIYFCPFCGKRIQIKGLK